MVSIQNSVVWMTSRMRKPFVVHCGNRAVGWLRQLAALGTFSRKLEAEHPFTG
jgi:hypothetical protein